MLPTDLLVCIAQALALDGCDPTFTMLSKLCSLSYSQMYSHHLERMQRPVVLNFTTVPDNLTATLPVYCCYIIGQICIDWGDATVEILAKPSAASDPIKMQCTGFFKNTPLPTHSYSGPGQYCVRIFRNTTRSRLTHLSHQHLYINDPRRWTSNLSSVLSIGSIGVVSLATLFAEEPEFDLPLAHVDVSAVERMDHLFFNCSKFNQPIGRWNVGRVIHMYYMFAGCQSFNQVLERWNVGNVQTMLGMFSDAAKFNSPLQRWNVSSVRSMTSMFCSAREFNQPLNCWDVSNVQTMSYMFEDAVRFNQPLDSWDVSSVESMRGMFINARSFSQPLDNWGISAETDVEFMCKGLRVFKNQ